MPPLPKKIRRLKEMNRRKREIGRQGGRPRIHGIQPESQPIQPGEIQLPEIQTSTPIQLASASENQITTTTTENQSSSVTGNQLGNASYIEIHDDDDNRNNINGDNNNGANDGTSLGIQAQNGEDAARRGSKEHRKTTSTRKRKSEGLEKETKRPKNKTLTDYFQSQSKSASGPAPVPTPAQSSGNSLPPPPHSSIPESSDAEEEAEQEENTEPREVILKRAIDDIKKLLETQLSTMSKQDRRRHEGVLMFMNMQISALRRGESKRMRCELSRRASEGQGKGEWYAQNLRRWETCWIEQRIIPHGMQGAVSSKSAVTDEGLANFMRDWMAQYSKIATLSDLAVAASQYMKSDVAGDFLRGSLGKNNPKKNVNGDGNTRTNKKNLDDPDLVVSVRTVRKWLRRLGLVFDRKPGPIRSESSVPVPRSEPVGVDVDVDVGVGVGVGVGAHVHGHERADVIEGYDFGFPL